MGIHDVTGEILLAIPAASPSNDDERRERTDPRERAGPG
jgi:hypothetical protein